MITENKNFIKVLKESYKESVMAYILAFEKKHEIKFDGWVGDIFGEVAYFGDYSIYFSDIMTDINLNAPKESYFDWDELTININYKNWLLAAHGIK